MSKWIGGRVANWTDIVAGLVLLAICGTFVFMSMGYGLGRPARIGAGFFPFLFGIAGMAIAVMIILRAIRIPADPDELLPIQARSLLFICGGLVAFVLLIERAGLGPAVFAATVISAMADREARVFGTLVLSGVLVVSIWLIFVYILGMPIRLWEFGR